MGVHAWKACVSVTPQNRGFQWLASCAFASESPKMCLKIEIPRHHPRSKESDLQEDGAQRSEFLTVALGDSDVPWPSGVGYLAGNTHLSTGVRPGYSFLLASFTNLFYVPHIPSCQRNGM